MLKFRSEQIDVLDEATTERFYRRLLTFLREEIPEATSSMDDEALTERIIESEKRAAQYDIESQAGIAQFVCLTFVAGPRFDEIPEIREYLRQSEPHGEEKLDELVNYLDALEDDPDAKPADILLQPED